MLKYKNLSIIYTKEECFYEVKSELQAFDILMTSQINKNITDIPISYLSKSDQVENYVWKITFTKFTSFNENLSSVLRVCLVSID